jgi:hypothetical protein
MLAVTPQRMRMIVDGFIDVLELGLEKEGQMVVSSISVPYTAAYRLSLADRCSCLVWLHSPCFQPGFSDGLVAKRLDHTLLSTSAVLIYESARLN